MSAIRKNIDSVIIGLRKAEMNLPDPSVTMVSRRWNDPFLVLISCILSLRTKDSTTIPASERLFVLAKTPQDMVKLTAQKIQKLIYPVGFYKTKSRTILGICRRLIKEFNGRVPDDLDVLLTFKGVGRKTANLVLAEGFGIPAICVDTHVHRISNRLGYVQTRNPAETEFALRKQLPKKYWIEYNALLVIWGQNICAPISPWCSRCVIREYCEQVGVNKQR